MVCFRHVFVTSDDGFSCLSVSLVISSKLDTSCLVKVIELHRHLCYVKHLCSALSNVGLCLFVVVTDAKGLKFLCHFVFRSLHGLVLEGMVTHSSVLAWRTPWTGEPGELQSMGSHRAGHEWSDLTCMCAEVAFPLYCFSEDGSAFHRFF